MKQNNECKKCGYKWKSKLIKPISCPRCKRYDWWKEEIKEVKQNE